MKSISKILIVCALFGAAASSRADVTVAVDSTQTWLGYMNVSNLPSPDGDGVFQFGQGWGTADLVAGFSGGVLTLSPNTIGDPAAYWYTPSGGPGATGNKIMDASFYVEKNDGSLSGQTVTFSGTVTANSFTSAHTTIAYIKDFASDYSSFNVATSAVLTTGAFSINLLTDAAPGRHVQYGFQTIGPDVWVTDVAPFGNIQIQDVPTPFVPDQIPNGDFEIPAGASWGTVQGTPLFPNTGGNPDGNAVIDGTGGFAVLYAFNNTEKSFASLGLAPGDTYIVQMDMKINSGTNIGGLRLEGPAGYVVESFPTLIGDGSTWETYSIELTVPDPGATQAKFGLRPGGGSIVAFDNVLIVLPTPAEAPQPAILIGKTVSWMPTVVDNFYQPQESADGSVYMNLGSAFVGTTVSSIFDPTPAPFYRVQESAPVVKDVAYNGGFEIEFIGEAEGWTLNNQEPTLITTDAHTGTNSIQILATGSDGMAGVSGLEQNTTNATDDANPGGPGPFVSTGKTYSLSFWAKQINVGDGYVQRFLINWLDGEGAIVNGSGASAGVNQTFATAPLNTWTQFGVNGLVAPAAAVSVQILIQGETGAFPASTGEVIIDDVAFVTTGAGSTTTIAATNARTAEISWQSAPGQTYQVRSSTDLSGFAPFAGPINGNGSIQKVYDTPLVTKKFYQLGTED